MSAVNTVNAVNMVNPVQNHSRPPQAADNSSLLRDQIEATFSAATRATQR
ncbi:MAG: hypothetical protein LW850_27170 [Planctomycetaceae bacterium]|jgi:hypothetical protein|nr:hypothetical protein [Planctomycetaceae bacterium]